MSEIARSRSRSLVQRTPEAARRVELELERRAVNGQTWVPKASACQHEPDPPQRFARRKQARARESARHGAAGKGNERQELPHIRRPSRERDAGIHEGLATRPDDTVKRTTDEGGVVDVRLCQDLAYRGANVVRVKRCDRIDSGSRRDDDLSRLSVRHVRDADDGEQWKGTAQCAYERREGSPAPVDQPDQHRADFPAMQPGQEQPGALAPRESSVSAQRVLNERTRAGWAR